MHDRIADKKGAIEMKPIMDKTDKILLTLFLMSLAAYLVIFLSAFWDLPLNIPPWLAT